MIDMGEPRRNPAKTVAVIFAVIAVLAACGFGVYAYTRLSTRTVSVARSAQRVRVKRRQPSKQARPVSGFIQSRKNASGDETGDGMAGEDVCDRLATVDAYWLVTQPEDVRQQQLAVRLAPNVPRLDASQYAFDYPPYEATLQAGSSETRVTCLVHVTRDPDQTVSMTFSRQPDNGWAVTRMDIPPHLLRKAVAPGS